MHSHDAISREKGTIAVEARTTVELDQAGSCVGCVLVDVEELPQTLRAQATNPILLAYKYLLPDYTLGLSVKKHGDVDVLIAAVDVAYFTATKVEEGRVMYKLLMKVRNTQKQYARIDLASSCEIWSVVVKGQAVKPARDRETNALMIPLEKGGKGQSENKHAAFSIEVVWVDDSTTDGNGSAMRQRGHVDLHFPKVDLPLNVVLISAYMPASFNYGEFTVGRDAGLYVCPCTDCYLTRATSRSASTSHRASRTVTRKLCKSRMRIS